MTYFASPGVPLDAPTVGSACVKSNFVHFILVTGEARSGKPCYGRRVSNPAELTLLFSVKTFSLLYLLIKVTGSKIIAILKWLLAHPTCGQKATGQKNWVSHGAVGPLLVR